MGAASGFQPKSNRINLKNIKCGVLVKCESSLSDNCNRCAAFACFHHICLGYSGKHLIYSYLSETNECIYFCWLDHLQINWHGMPSRELLEQAYH